jgi:hypothetical protein
MAFRLWNEKCNGVNELEHNGKTGVVMVLTSDTAEKIIADAGVFVPRINSEKVMSTCAYVVCVQNNPDNIEDETLYGHKEAFLIGTVSGVSPSNANGDKLVKFDSYAEIQKRNAWINGPIRIGVAYYDTPTEAKLRVGAYSFQPVKFAPSKLDTSEAKNLFAESLEFANNPATTPTKNTGFDLTEAKAVIAKALGVAIDQIEITIKA